MFNNVIYGTGFFLRFALAGKAQEVVNDFGSPLAFAIDIIEIGFYFRANPLVR